ncbi:MAG: PAS domain-containing protein, partial [Planctomycetota bacterium]
MQQDARLRAGISPRQVILLILLASAGIAASALLCGALRRGEQAKLRTSFEQTARERVSALKAHIEESLHALDWVEGLHNDSTEVNRLEFRGFVQPYLAFHPEIQALGWVPRVQDARRAVYEAAAREDGCAASSALLAKARTSVPWITKVSGLGFTGLLAVLGLVIFQRIARSKQFTAELVISQQKLKNEIAEREKAEQELLASEERYRNIFNSACEAIFVIDSNGRIIGANPKASQIYGYLPEDFVGVPVKKLIHSDDDHVLDEHVAILAGTGEFHAEYRGIRKDGTTIHVEASATTTMYEGGKYLLSIVNDITERRQAEEALKDKTRLNQMLLDSMPCIALLMRPHSREIVAFNRAARDAGAAEG